MLRARLATAAVAIPALLALILYSPVWPFAAVVGVIAVLGLDEYAAMAFAGRRGERVLTTGLGSLVLVAALYQADGRLLAAALTLTVATELVWVLFARPDFEQGLRDVGLSLAGILYVGLFMPYFVWVRRAAPDGPLWVIFVLLIAMAGDTGGYATGHLIGRHKLAPRISPGKTIEGAIGIVLVSLLAGAAAKLIFLPVTWTTVLVLAGIMAVIGQLGDLSESIMKRTFNVKESGWVLPGHGGVLDRIDSLLFPVAFVYYYIVFLR